MAQLSLTTLQSMNLLSIESLWLIALTTRNDEVQKAAANFLCDVFVRFQAKNLHERNEVNSQFAFECMHKLQATKGGDAELLNCIKLLSNFVYRYDGYHIENESPYAFDKSGIQEVTIIQQTDKSE